ncbi:MAG TPA: tetratricopeptide repeat protein, partial [Oxalicibacterium sp.]|nr:tetratricopeptide repeat protein [Oxalicibacterium sp.]
KSAASTQATVAKPVAPQPVSTQPAVSDTPVALDKQVRPLTPQQRAENDYRRAAAMAEQGRAAEATALLEHVLQEVPAHIGARQTLIALLLRAGQQDEAMRRAKEGLDIDMRQPGLAMILARLQVEKGAQQTAIATLQNSLPYAADQPDYRAFLAALLQRAGRQKEAVEQYLLAVRAVPQNGIWWMGLGISLQADGRMEEARQAFSRSRETSSLSPELRAFVEQKLKQLH